MEAKAPAVTRRFMDDTSFDLRHRAFMQGAKPPALEKCTGEAEDVRIVRRVSDHVRLYAELECSGMVILSDTFYPGWEATIDGKPVPIHEMYSVIRGVVAPKGRHWIDMRYRPKSVYLGFLLTLAGLALCGAANYGRSRLSGGFNHIQ